jgi:hypothetical protein
MEKDWRIGGAYSYLDVLGSKAFAWEFLRRNPEYQADYQSIVGKGDAAYELLVQRWGCAIDPTLRADHPALVVWLQEEPAVMG